METMTLRHALERLIEGRDLSREEARQAMRIIMDGEATPSQIGALMALMRMKGETIDEITGFVETMRSKATKVETGLKGLLDTCGTGGDGGRTFNISTAASIIAAAGGVPVAKHGNRAMSSKSGSADVLEALGVNISLNPEQAAECLREVGICFMFSQLYHQSMKHAAAPRKELGFRTFFNILGPLTNPAGADIQLMGVYDRDKTEFIARVMRELGLKRALVVSSYEGLDEISICSPTQVTELNEGEIRTYTVTAGDLGLAECGIEEIAGGKAEENAQILRNIYAGQKGPKRDIVLANAAACFYVAGRCSSLREGVQYAEEIIDSGKALAKLEELIDYTGALRHVS